MLVSACVHSRFLACEGFVMQLCCSCMKAFATRFDEAAIVVVIAWRSLQSLLLLRSQLCRDARLSFRISFVSAPLSHSAVRSSRRPSKLS